MATYIISSQGAVRPRLYFKPVRITVRRRGKVFNFRSRPNV